MSFVNTVLKAILFSFLLISIPSFAQVPGLEPSISDPWRKEGQLVTIQISQGNPIRIFVVGREEAKIDLSNLALTVRRIKPYPGKILSVDRNNNYFVVTDAKEFKKSKEIEVVTKIKDKEETFRFELKQRTP